MDIQAALKQLTAGASLSGEQMHAVMRQIMTGQLTEAQIGGFLIALQMKGESVEEITAAATVMRELVTRVDVSMPHLIDVVGTGGDGRSSFNVSTASAFVAVAAGASVAKHGNRAASSNSGSADLLEISGARIDLDAHQVARCVHQTGFGFMLAPAHHTAMKHAIGARRELGVRTIFNVLGPLTNPAHVTREMMGVFSPELVEPLARVLAKLGSEHVLVVHSDDGLDEISISAPTRIAELRDGEVHAYKIQPSDFDMQPGAIDAIVVSSPGESLAMIKAVLGGTASPAANITALNAGAAIYVAGLASTLRAGVAKAREIITSGAALQRFEDYIQFTRHLKDGEDA